MLKRLGALFHKDFLMGIKNYYLAIMVFTALLFVVLTNFVIPQEASIDNTVYYYIENGAEVIFQDVPEALGLNQPLNSRQEIKKKMKENINSIGMVMQLSEDGKPLVEYILQGYENEKVKKLLSLPLENMFNASTKTLKLETVYLKDRETLKETSFNLLLVPLFVLFEPALLGLVLIATMIFIEKEEETIKGFAVTPGRLWEFLLSKVLFILFLSLISTLIITLFTVGVIKNLGYLLFIVGVGSIFSSSLGLLVSSFFDTITKAMMWLVFVSLILTVPMISYFTPGFAPGWMQWMPTYPLLFGIKEAIFPSGNLEFLIVTGWRFLLISAITFLIAVFMFQKNLQAD